MPQPVVDDDVLQVVVEGTNETTPWAWVSHWVVNSVADTEDLLSAITSHIIGSFLGPLADLLTDQWRAECMSIGRVAPQPMNVLLQTASFPIVGEVTTDGIPNTSSVVVRLSTDETGPRNRGRMFLCGVPEAATDGGLITSTFATALEAIMPGLIAAVSSGGNSASMSIFSRTAYGPGPTHPAAVADYTSPITDFDVQFNLATIRRRRRRRSVAP